MPLDAKFRFLQVRPGVELEGVLQLSALLVDGSTSVEAAHHAKFVAEDRPKVHVDVCLDLSGSMSPYEALLQQSVDALIKLLPIGSSSIRITGFDDRAFELLPLQPIENDDKKNELSAWTSKLRVSHGSTNLYDGLNLMTTCTSDADIWFLLLLSDGQANVGRISSDEMIELVKSSLSTRVQPCILTSIGFNDPQQLDIKTLTSLAAFTDGNKHIVQTKEAVTEAFGDVLGDLISLTCTGVKLSDAPGISFSPSMRGIDKLQGLHIRLGAPKYIPFKLDKEHNPSIQVTYTDLGTKSVKTDVVTVCIPAEQAIDYEVDEYIILDLSANAFVDYANAFSTVIREKQKIPPPIYDGADFVAPPSKRAKVAAQFPSPAGSPRALQRTKNVTFAPDDTIVPPPMARVGARPGTPVPEEPEIVQDHFIPEVLNAYYKQLDENYKRLVDAYDAACKAVTEQFLGPVRQQLTALLARIDANPRNTNPILTSLKAQIMEMLTREVSNERLLRAAFDVVHQRSSASGADCISFGATPSIHAARVCSRTVSANPGITSQGASAMLAQASQSADA